LNGRDIDHDGTLLATLVKGGSHSRVGGKMKSILDPTFRYTKSVDTDLRKTFARIQRDLRKQQSQQSGARVDPARKVIPFHSP
jgi:hypothetical protein